MLVSTLFHIALLLIECRGLKFVSKNRVARLQAIAVQLGRLNYDIVALQEIWVLADYELVRASVSSRLPYAKYFYRLVDLLQCCV